MENPEYALGWLCEKISELNKGDPPESGTASLVLMSLELLERKLDASYQPDPIRNEKLHSARHWVLVGIGAQPPTGFSREMALGLAIGDLTELEKRGFVQ